ncbi:hypothetical protein D2Q93_00845 [Alicyclobacillaceae bacterium I2511]|nr:hypothetical protein D2Q93_00845 [Alicyclobacillaceae bacterium I2511]
MSVVESPAISFLQVLLTKAVALGCSDVHLFTVGGKLQSQGRLGNSIVPLDVPLEVPDGQSVLRRIKVLAGLDVAESRLPQDGAFHWHAASFLCDVRVATLPTVQGETAVLRLLPIQTQEENSLQSLGMSPDQIVGVRTLLERSTGLVAVAGSTGSGKTTTLYALMLELVRQGKRVVSIEDPVEQVLSGCHQVQVREKVGISFESGLRACLRHDPDVIMVGEVRDGKTAQVAVRAALTGHLVLTTTHANDFIGTAIRLADLGIPRNTIGEVLKAVVMQKLYTSRTFRDSPPLDGMAIVKRTGVFSLNTVTPEQAEWISSDLNWVSVRTAVLAAGEPARLSLKAQ